MSDWRDRAACAGTNITPDDDPFFPVLEAKAKYLPGMDYCNQCPVLANCAAFALTVPLLHGVWAGIHVPGGGNNKSGRSRAFAKLRIAAKGTAT